MTDFSKLPPECDELCRYRECFQHGENKGTFIPGRGYTSYHKKPIHVCMTRHMNGCPDDRMRTVKWDEIKANVNKSRCSKKLKILIVEIIDHMNRSYDSKK